MKELFKEMAECKNEIRSLKSIVRCYLFSIQSNHSFFCKVLSENRFIKRRSISTGNQTYITFFINSIPIS